MIEAKEKEIDGVTYIVTQLGALQGQKVFARIAKIIAPGLTGGTGKAGVDAAIGNLLASAVERLDPEELAAISAMFAKQTRYRTDGGKTPLLSDSFDIHFAGRYLQMAEWLLFCFEVNFGSFLEGLGAKMRAVATAPKAEKEQP